MNKEKRSVPKLRFPGFTEDWEQRKFLDLLDAQNGIRRGPFGSSLKKDSFVKKSDYVVYEQQNAIYDNYETRYFISKEKYNELIRFNIQPGDFIMSGAGTIGRISMVPDGIKKGVFNQALIRFKVNKDSINPLYFLKFMQSDMMQKQLTQANPGSAMTNLVPMDELKKWDVIIPSLEEQNRISTFINQMDAFITLHQRKLEHLKLKKKALLQKLFPKNGERYPELRFPGFTDAWEQRKLGQFTARVTRKNGGQSDLPLTISAQDGLVDQRKYFNRQVASRDMSNYYLIKKGEFAYNKSYSEGYPFGAVKRLDYYDIGALSTLYILFEITDKNISSDFIVSYYMTHLWYKEISKRAAEGARNHGLLNISTEDFFDSELNIPNSIEEQVKIGNFIKAFDKFITLHQRKLGHLQLQKKALLQQMFV